jgi:hypothetical protein
LRPDPVDKFKLEKQLEESETDRKQVEHIVHTYVRFVKVNSVLIPVRGEKFIDENPGLCSIILWEK